jgi:hypothetical protein
MTPSASETKADKAEEKAEARRAERPQRAELPDKLKPENYPEEGFRDVSDEAEADPDDTEATAVVNAEMSHRATAQANGGGPWPPELIAEKFIGAGQPVVAALPAYTSHEEAEEAGSSKTAASKK